MTIASKTAAIRVSIIGVIKFFFPLPLQRYVDLFSGGAVTYLMVLLLSGDMTCTSPHCAVFLRERDFVLHARDFVLQIPDRIMDGTAFHYLVICLAYLLYPILYVFSLLPLVVQFAILISIIGASYAYVWRCEKRRRDQQKASQSPSPARPPIPNAFDTLQQCGLLEIIAVVCIVLGGLVFISAPDRGISTLAASAVVLGAALAFNRWRAQERLAHLGE
jgi:hypothetical protein